GPALLRRVEPRVEVGQSLIEIRPVARPKLAELLADRLRDAPAVFRIEPVMRIAERMDVAHRARDLTGRNLENRGGERRVEVAFAARLDLLVAALLHQRRQPPDLELASDDDEQIGLL